MCVCVCVCVCVWGGGRGGGELVPVHFNSCVFKKQTNIFALVSSVFLFVCFVSVYYNSAVEKKWRTSSVSYYNSAVRRNGGLQV